MTKIGNLALRRRIPGQNVSIHIYILSYNYSVIREIIIKGATCLNCILFVFSQISNAQNIFIIRSDRIYSLWGPDWDQPVPLVEESMKFYLGPQNLHIEMVASGTILTRLVVSLPYLDGKNTHLLHGSSIK